MHVRASESSPCIRVVLPGVSGALEDKDEKKDGAEEEDPEIAEAKREAEEKRNEKYRKIEEERETMRQGIRDKYHIQKKEVVVEDPGLDGRLGRKKKSPEELAAEGEGGEGGEAAAHGTGIPKNLDELKAKVSEIPGSVMTTVSGVQEKCSVQ